MAYGSTNIIARMKGATETKAGRSGIVPPPPAGAIMKFLRGDGVWGNDDTKIDKSDIVQNATTSATNKIVSAAVAKNLQDQITKQNTNMEYHVGDTINLWFMSAGYLTGGGTSIYISIPLAKPLASNVTKGIVTMEKIEIRQGGGYLTESVSGLTFDFLKNTKDFCRLRITSPNAFTALNNEVVGVFVSGKIVLS